MHECRVQLCTRVPRLARRETGDATSIRLITRATAIWILLLAEMRADVCPRPPCTYLTGQLIICEHRYAGIFFERPVLGLPRP